MSTASLAATRAATCVVEPRKMIETTDSGLPASTTAFPANVRVALR